MKIALAQTTSIWVGQDPVPVEPATLVGMFNQLKVAGHDVKLLHNTNGCKDGLVGQIDEFDPKIIGLSAAAMSPRNGIATWGEAVSRFKARDVTVIMGGKGPTFNPQQYAEEAQPDVIVVGPGEPIMEAFIHHGFDWKALRKEQIFKGMMGSTLLFGLDRCDAGNLNLDSIGYERDYDLADYRNMGWPLLQLGCLHHCIFCPGDLPVSYKSPQSVVEEVRYLIMQKGAKIIWPLGSDFTASARKSAAIIEALAGQSFVSDTIFRFGVRLDSFWRSVQKYRQEWEQFAASVPHIRLNTGIESFLGERRWRMRKDFSEKRSMEHTAIVDRVLAWAQDMGNVGIEGSFIMIDPESTLAEFHRELDEIEKRVSGSGGSFRAIRGILHNCFDATIGTPSIKMYPPPEGDKKYENDPRLRLLYVYMFYAWSRDCGEAVAASGGDHVKEDLFLISRLRKVAERIEKKVGLRNLDQSFRKAKSQARIGNFSFFDEG